MSALGPMAGGPPPGFPDSITIGGGSPSDSGGGPSGASDSSGDSWENELQVALSALRKLASDAPDHMEAETVDKCVVAIQGLLAQRQKGAESALGVTPAHKAMSRAY